jgi:hypothetical protein
MAAAIAWRRPWVQSGSAGAASSVVAGASVSSTTGASVSSTGASVVAAGWQAARTKLDITNKAIKNRNFLDFMFYFSFEILSFVMLIEIYRKLIFSWTSPPF